MNKKTTIIIGVLLVLGALTGLLVYKTMQAPKSPTIVEEEEFENVKPADPSLVVEVKESTAKENTVLVHVSGLAGKYASLAYELTYESEGLIKGVNSGSKPLDVSGQPSFERDIYLGTCSKNVCKPDKGVSTVSVVIEFIDGAGEKSQFTKDFPL